MRRNFRVQASNISHALNSTKFKSHLLQNIYFIQFTKDLSSEEVAELLDTVRIQFFTSKKHISVYSQKLYLTFSHTTLLTSTFESKGPSVTMLDEFEKKYGDIIEDEDKLYKRRIQVLYHRFEVVQESRDPFVYNLSRFFDSNLQKSHDIVLTKTDDIVTVIEKNKLSETLFSKLKSCYTHRLSFLKSFPLLKHIPDFYLHLYLPCFLYSKYYASSKIEVPKEEHVYFLLNGQLQFSKRIQRAEIKIYKIIGQQMFVIIEGVDSIKVTGEAVELYYIKKSQLDKLVTYDNNCESYHNSIKDNKIYHINLKQKACVFHKSSHSSNLDNKQQSNEVSPLIRESFRNLNIFTKQFSKHITQMGENKTKVLNKLLEKSSYNSFLYQHKPIIKTTTNMDLINSRIKNMKQNQYSKIKQYKQNKLVTAYKSLVAQGLEEELTPFKSTHNSKDKRSSKRMEDSFMSDRFSNVVLRSSVYDILSQYD